MECIFYTFYVSRYAILFTACKLGYFGSLCDTPCLPGFYGKNCAGACHPLCSTEECDPRYGCTLTTADIIPKTNSSM